jgi:hypothetical protein
MCHRMVTTGMMARAPTMRYCIVEMSEQTYPPTTKVLLYVVQQLNLAGCRRMGLFLFLGSEVE